MNNTGLYNAVAGGVYNAGNTSLHGCRLSGNAAYSNGGGVYNDFYAHLNLSSSTLDANRASLGFGGAILNDGGTVSISKCTLTRNTAALGGAIANGLNVRPPVVHPPSTLHLAASIITANLAHGNDRFAASGGGIYNLGAAYLRVMHPVVNNSLEPSVPPAGEGADAFNGGSYVYVLPAPRGFYLGPAVFPCKLLHCYGGECPTVRSPPHTPRGHAPRPLSKRPCSPRAARYRATSQRWVDV